MHEWKYLIFIHIRDFHYASFLPIAVARTWPWRVFYLLPIVGRRSFGSVGRSVGPSVCLSTPVTRQPKLRFCFKLGVNIPDFFFVFVKFSIFNYYFFQFLL